MIPCILRIEKEIKVRSPSDEKREIEVSEKLREKVVESDLNLCDISIEQWLNFL